jgi:ribosome-associated protein
MIRIAPGVDLDESELDLDFVKSGGPGGQKVNKTSSAVVLRFDVAGSPSLPDEVRERLLTIAGSRIGSDGILTIHSRKYRSQNRNREDAIHKLKALIARAAEKPVRRRPTRKPASANEKRLRNKKKRGELKRTRTTP